MNKLIELENKLIGSKEDILALSKKENARILTVSDSHQNIQNLLSIIQNYGSDCDALIHCGDGCSDLFEILQNAKKDDSLKNTLPPVIAYVKGNCDYITSPPPKQILCVNGINLLIVHGHIQNVNFGYEKLGFEAKLLNCRAAIYGHTHIAKMQLLNDTYFINPGSCSLPRANQYPGFAIITVGNNFIDTAFLHKKKSITDSDFTIYTPLA